MTFKPKKYMFEKNYPLSKQVIWHLLSDTNRVNLYIGLFPAVFSPVKKRETGLPYRLAAGKAKGVLPVSWEDEPFEWEKEKTFSVSRSYGTGPIQQYNGTVELLDSPDPLMTTVRLTAEFLPRSAAGVAAVPLVSHRNIKKKFDYLDHYIASGAKNLFSQPQKNPAHKVNEPELDRLVSKLKQWPVQAAHADWLRAYVIEESTQDVARMEPLLIAQRWNINPDEAVRLFLYAVKTGLLNLSWNVMCPNCRVAKAVHASLSGLQAQFHCDLCGVNYDANFDQHVELTFSVHSAVRQAHHEVYCIGGPSVTPHVWAQKVIARGGTLTLAVPAEESGLQLRVLQANAVASIVPHGAAGTGRPLQYSDAGWSHPCIAPCPEVTIRNTSSADILLVLEQTRHKQAVTAARVTAMQQFRDLFSSEVLAPGQKIDINHVTVLFTDLKQSTSLYEAVGDASAFRQVRDHFAFITGIVSRHSGSVVKTMGDAVMAVFHLPENGLHAALDIQKSLAAYRESRQNDFVLKAGLFSGPAIAVNSNERLDYFGRTVNMAARIQEQSNGNDIIVSREVLAHPDSAKLLSGSDVKVEPFSADLKGMKGKMDLVRVQTKNRLAPD